MDVIPYAGGCNLKKGNTSPTWDRSLQRRNAGAGMNYFRKKLVGFYKKQRQVEKPNEVAVKSPGNQNSFYYDMSKNKYLYIFNHFKFSRTRAFGYIKPCDRNGTHFDVKLLETTFKSLGFEVKVFQDLTRHKIKGAIKKIIHENDHSKTSCVALAILSHGSYDGYLFAEDEHYKIKEITKLLEHRRLVMIPKLLFLQISMVMEMMSPRPIISRQMRRWRSSFRRLTRSINKAQMRNRGTTTDSDAPAIKNDISKEVAALDKDNCKEVAAIEIACHNEVAAVEDCCNGVEVDVLPSNLVHVPSHIDFLILHSAADGHAPFRCTEAGSWMIQSLCKIIQEYHTQLDINQLITLVNHRVAYDYPSYNNTKQPLETRYTLTKFLKL